MPFQPGQSGNPGGKVEKLFQSALKRAIARDDAKRLRAAAEKLLDLAAAGEYWAVQMLADRLDGKPKQQLEAIDEEGRTFTFVRTVYSDNPTPPVQAKALSAPDPESTGLRH